MTRIAIVGAGRLVFTRALVSDLCQQEATVDAEIHRDYVINTVQVGGKEATRVDFDVPEKFGARQTIADTHGIGGISRALQTVPPVLEICNQLLTVAGIFERSRDTICQAALLDPLLSAQLTLDEITSLVDELIAAHGNPGGPH